MGVGHEVGHYDCLGKGMWLEGVGGERGMAIQGREKGGVGETSSEPRSCCNLSVVENLASREGCIPYHDSGRM